jgi:hypothetical protein
MSSGERAAEIARRLRGLEARRRALSALGALGAWVSIVLPAAALFCFADWYQHMPLVARWVSLVALVALAVFAFRRLVLPVMRARRSLDQSALSVERSFPEMADGVITAVQLDRRWGQFGYGSDELRTAAQNQAMARAAEIGFGRAEPISRYAPPILLGAVLVALAALGTASFPRIVGIWAARCFWTCQYPHKTRVEECPAERLVARGETAEVPVRAGGIIPSRGVLRVKSRSSGWSSRELLPVAGGARGEFLARVEEVVEPMTFRVKLGDAPEVEGAIKVVDRPEVAAVRTTLSYPEYTRLPAESFLSGHVRAVPGAGVALEITPSKPLSSADLVFSDGSRLTATTEKTAEKPEAKTETGPEGEKRMADGGSLSLVEGGTRLSARFEVRRTGSYEVVLVDTQGFSNRSASRSPVSYKISAVPDAPPRVTLVRPGAEALATPVSVLRLSYRISDDYGLRRGRLRFRRNEDKEWREFPLPLPGVDPKKPKADIPRPGPRRADQTFLWDLSTLGFKVGDMIAYRLEAEDHAARAEPRPGATGEQLIRVVSSEVIVRKLREDLEVTAKEIERVFLLEKGSQERIRKLLEEIRRLKEKRK